MLISPATGKVIHHKDCTYCTHRMGVKFKKKGKLRERELCEINMHDIPNNRYCDHYSQEGCKCDQCGSTSNHPPLTSRRNRGNMHTKTQ